jgi:hypothetical protein
MIDRLVGNKLIPASIRQNIIERTDGIPLFVEEITKAVLEAESERVGHRGHCAVARGSVTIRRRRDACLFAQSSSALSVENTVAVLKRSPVRRLISSDNLRLNAIACTEPAPSPQPRYHCRV